jgi:hypothetical protein
MELLVSNHETSVEAIKFGSDEPIELLKREFPLVQLGGENQNGST